MTSKITVVASEVRVNDHIYNGTGSNAHPTFAWETVTEVRLEDGLILVITGNANDQVTLDNSGWINTQQTVSLNQHTYVLWQNGSANVLVDKQISTHAVL